MGRNMDTAFANLYFVLLSSVVAFQVIFSTAVAGGSLQRGSFQVKQRRSLIKMSDLLLQLDRKRIDKRTADVQLTKSVSSSNNSISLDKTSTVNKKTKSKRTAKRVDISSINGKTNSTTDGYVIAKHRVNKKRKQKKLRTNKFIKTDKSQNNAKNDNLSLKRRKNKVLSLQMERKSKLKETKSKNSHAHRTNNKSTLFKARNILANDSNKRRTKSRKSKHRFVSRGSEMSFRLPTRIPFRNYHLIRIPLFSFASPYNERFPEYIRNGRSRMYYGDVAYDPENDYDDYYAQERKDVIPKPEFATVAVRGAKKDTFVPEKGFKQTAYSPIVSAVQNLDQSEANLFDSLLSTGHETTRLNDNIGSELASFAGSPSDLEVYTPTDTPGELYFEKDASVGNPTDDTQYFTHKTTSKPSAGRTTSNSFGDNEEKLLSIVEKVIEKQQKKNKAKSSTESEKLKPQSTVMIGDTSEVFNTGHSDHETAEKENKDKLQDFLSRQPKFDKKMKSSKTTKHASKTPGKVAITKHKAKMQTAKGKGSKVISEMKKQKLQKSFPFEKLKPPDTGHYVIVENVSPANDKLLMESMKQADQEEDRANVKTSTNKAKLHETELQIDTQGSRKTITSRFSKNGVGNMPHMIKEIINEKEPQRVEDNQIAGFSRESERHAGYEVLPSSATDSKAGRWFTINEEGAKVVSERNPNDGAVGGDSSEPAAHKAMSGDKRDEDAKENKTAVSNDTESPSEKSASNSSADGASPAEEPKVAEDAKNQTRTESGGDEKTPKAGPSVPAKLSKQQTGEDFADWFNDESPEPQKPPPVATPPEAGSVTPPVPKNQTTNWRIRDYFLDDQNASNWDQIRTAWTNKNGTPFVFNNRIQVNPSGNKPVTLPPIQFGAGVTMPTLPTMAAPTGVPMHGFPNDDDEEDEEDEDDDEVPKQMKMQQQQQQPLMQQQQIPATTPSFGLQYPWQWHNRRPKEGRYHGTNLHFHGRPTVHTLVVTTKKPTTSVQQVIVTRPTVTYSKQGEVDSAKNVNNTANAEEQQNEAAQEQMKEKTENESQEQGNQPQEVKGQEEDKGQTTVDERNEQSIKGDKGHEMEEKEALSKETDENSKETVGKIATHDHGSSNESTATMPDGNVPINNEDKESSHQVEKGVWSESTKFDGVLNESMTHSNTTVRQLDKTSKAYSRTGYNEGSQFGNLTSFTKPPEGLPMLSEPTTKSMQNFLPGLKPPSTTYQNLQNDKKYLEFPPWSGGYVKELRKSFPKAGTRVDKVDANIKGSASADELDKSVDAQLNKILVEESTKKLPSDESMKQEEKLPGAETAEEGSQDSFSFESKLLQKEENENAANRAKVSDTPINMQAESINLIRQRASASQKPEQRQQVLVGNGTNIAYAGDFAATGKDMQQQMRQPDYHAEATGVKEQKSPFMITQGGSSQGNSRHISEYAASQPPTGSGKTQRINQPRPSPTASPTATPKTTVAIPRKTPFVSEEIHHPTPKPLFPFNILSKTLSKATVGMNKGSGTEKTGRNEMRPPTATQNVSYSPPTVSNFSSLQQNEEVRYQSGKTKTESTTTPSSIGYKTTDWAKAFTTTERTGNYLPELQSSAGNKGNEVSAAANQPHSSTQNNNTPITVVEGKYQTDTATMRTTPGTAQRPLIVVPSAATAYSYQNAYPSGIPSYAPQPPIVQVNSYAPSGNTAGWNVPGAQNAGAKVADSLSDAYLSKFGDQLNMEDLYWTDSTEEKEEICKQQKGTNEVVHFLCFGDSLTRGYYNKGKSHHPYTNKLQFLLNKLDTKKCYIVDNEGKDGELAYEEMPKRLESILKDGGTNYEWIVILGGTNDIYNKKKSKKASEQEITQNIISMHEIARQHKSKSVAVTIPEVYCETLDTCQDAKQLRERVNGNIRSYAYQNHDRVVLVDLADMLQRSNVGRDMVGQFFEGGLHLKPRGYERMAIIIFEGLKRALS